jgi:hypothetical protein
MPEVKTLQFLNTPEGQARKNEALVEHLQAGWSIVSETVTPGHIKGSQACCLATICLPLGFAAGRTEGVISVTLQRRGDVSANHSVKVTTNKPLVSANRLVEVTMNKPLSQTSRRALLGLLGLVFAVFLFSRCQEGRSPQIAEDKKEESKVVTSVPAQGEFTGMSPARHLNGRSEVLPYESLEAPQKVRNPAFLGMQGWEIGRDIHNKCGLRSNQPMRFDYRKVLHRSKDQVDAYLGEPVRTKGGEYLYRKEYGTITVRYKASRAHQLEVEFTQSYDSYISVLRSVGISKLVRPFAVNGATLLFNANMGNSLTIEPPFMNVIIYIPNLPEELRGLLGDRKQWRIGFFASA